MISFNISNNQSDNIDIITKKKKKKKEKSFDRLWHRSLTIDNYRLFSEVERVTSKLRVQEWKVANVCADEEYLDCNELQLRVVRFYIKTNDVAKVRS